MWLSMGEHKNRNQTEGAPNDDFVQTIRRWRNHRFHKISQIFKNKYITKLMVKSISVLQGIVSFLFEIYWH